MRLLRRCRCRCCCRFTFFENEPMKQSVFLPIIAASSQSEAIAIAFFGTGAYNSVRLLVRSGRFHPFRAFAENPGSFERFWGGLELLHGMEDSRKWRWSSVVLAMRSWSSCALRT